MPANPQVRTVLTGAAAENSFTGGVANRQGIQVVQDWYTYMALCGAGYQVRGGTVTTPLVGSVAIAATGAEMAADCVAGYTIMPVYLGVNVRLATGTLHEYAAKSVATVSSAGAAFVPLPLKSGGVPAVSTARVAATAGTVTVTTELATTTLRHWGWANPAAGATGALPTGLVLEWTPRMPPVLGGPRSFYVQIAATGTGPSYYAHFDYLEMLTTSLV